MLRRCAWSSPAAVVAAAKTSCVCSSASPLSLSVLLQATSAFHSRSNPQQQQKTTRKDQSSSPSSQQQQQSATLLRQEEARKITNVERKLSHMDADVFTNHLAQILKSNAAKVPLHVTKATFNEAERRVAVLPHRAFLHMLRIAGPASRAAAAAASATMPHQQKDNDSTTTAASAAREQVQSASTEFSRRAVNLFLERTRTHSRDVALALSESVVDAAYAAESFDQLVALSQFGGDKISTVADDHSTDLSLFRCLWRVICLGVKQVARVQAEGKKKVAILLNSSKHKSSSSSSAEESKTVEQIQEETRLAVARLEVQWRQAADAVWSNICRCNGAALDINALGSSSSSPKEGKDHLFATMKRFVVYGSSYAAAQDASSSGSSSSNSGGGGGSATQLVLDYGEMQFFHLIYQKQLFKCCHVANLSCASGSSDSTAIVAKPLQLYTALIRSCRTGLWLEQAQAYFDDYLLEQRKIHQQQQHSALSSSNLGATTRQDQGHHHHHHLLHEGDPKQQLFVLSQMSEVVLFMFLSVLNTARDYRRICALGNVIVDAAVQEHGGGGDGSVLVDALPANSSSSSPFLSDAVANSISGSVLSTVAQAAGEVHDSVLVSKCLTLILRKVAISERGGGGDGHKQQQQQQQQGQSSEVQSQVFEEGATTVSNAAMASTTTTRPTNFMIFQTLASAAKSGNPTFPALVDACIANGLITPERPLSSMQTFFESFGTESGSSDGGNSNNGNNKKKRMMKQSDEQYASTAEDVRMELLLQWAAACSCPQEEGERLLLQLEHRISAVRLSASRGAADDNNNNNTPSRGNAFLRRKESTLEERNLRISRIFTERIANHVLQLLHRLEHRDFLAWYRLAAQLGYSRGPWLELLVGSADRRRYELSDADRKYVLAQFRLSGASAAGMRPMLSYLKFDDEQQPLLRFKRNPSRETVPVDVAPTVLDPRAHFLRYGAHKVLRLERRAVDEAPVGVPSRRTMPLTYAVGPPQLEKVFASSLSSSSSSSTAAEGKSSPSYASEHQQQQDRDALLLQWYLCSTLEGMQLYGNSFGVLEGAERKRLSSLLNADDMDIGGGGGGGRASASAEGGSSGSVPVSVDALIQQQQHQMEMSGDESSGSHEAARLVLASYKKQIVEAEQALLAKA